MGEIKTRNHWSHLTIKYTKISMHIHLLHSPSRLSTHVACFRRYWQAFQPAKKKTGEYTTFFSLLLLLFEIIKVHAICVEIYNLLFIHDPWRREHNGKLSLSLSFFTLHCKLCITCTHTHIIFTSVVKDYGKKALKAGTKKGIIVLPEH